MKRNTIFTLFVGFILILAACKPVQPQPGATLSGMIDMGDKAERAEITFKVSNDGKAITSVRVDFTNIRCEKFNGGSMTMQFDGLNALITGGKFEVKSSNIGEISGRFTSSTAVEGTIHIITFNPEIGSAIECGTWDWSATGK